MNVLNRNKIYRCVVALLYALFFFIQPLHAITINGLHVGDYTGVANETYILNGTINGRFFIPAGNTTITVNNGGTLTQTLFIDSNNATAQIDVQAGGRLGGGIIERGNNIASTMNISGVVDNGIQLGTTGVKNITISGLFAQIGTISGDTRSIIGNNTASTYTFRNNAVINGTIELQGADDVVIADGVRINSILATGGNKTITLSGSTTLAGVLNTQNGNDTINVLYSTVTGNITTGTTGNDTVTLRGGVASASILLGGGTDTLNLFESSTVGIDITATNTLALTSTFSSTVRGTITVTNALTLNAPSGIIVTGTTTSGANSIYDVVRSTFNDRVNINGSTTITATNSSFREHIMHGAVGPLSIELINSSVTQDIDARNNTDTTDITVRNNSTVRTMRFGTGFNTLTSDTSDVTDVIASNLTIDSTNSHYRNDLSIANRLEATFTTSTIHRNISTNAGANINTFTSVDSRFLGNISLLGISTVDIESSEIVGELITGNNNDTVEIRTSTIDILRLGNGTDTLTLTDSTTGEIFTGNNEKTITATNAITGQVHFGQNNVNLTATNSSFFGIDSASIAGTDNTITLHETNTLHGPTFNIGTGSISLEKTLLIRRFQGAGVDNNTTLTGTTLTVANDAILELNPVEISNTTKLIFDSIETGNKKPITKIYLNTFSGIYNALDISDVKAITDDEYIVVLAGVRGKGSIFKRLEDVVISNATITPKVYNTYSVLNGNLYILEESTTKANFYDAVYKGVSPTNYGYAAAHAGVRSFNTSVWHSIASHFQEEAQMFRRSDGTKRESGSVLAGISVWAKGSYNTAVITPRLDAPMMNETTTTGLVGIDFANIELDSNTSMMLQVFAGFGTINSSFGAMSLPEIEFNTTQMATTVGGSIGVENRTHGGRGKLFASLTTWYSTVFSTLDSNIFLESNSWSNTSINGAFSLGYSLYAKKFIITPQMDLGYFHTLPKTYITPDMNEVLFGTESRMIGRGSIALGYATTSGITPYLRGGLEIPIFKGKGSGTVYMEDSEATYSYDTTGFTADATLGIAFRGGFKRLALSLSAETTFSFGDKAGIEAFAQIGLQF